MEATATTILSKRVLIVDDSIATRRMVRFALAVDPALEVLEASGLEEALGVLAGGPVDLMITDFHMPGGDGIELTRCVRALFSEEELPIVMLSGDTSPAARRWAQAAGASSWIEKPFKSAQVLALVRSILI